jgi:hypothetical protein
MAVSQSVIELRHLGAGMAERMQVGIPGVATPALSGSLGLRVDSVERMRPARVNSTSAYNALCELADTEPETLLPGAPPGS